MTTYKTQDAVLRKIGDERLLVPIKGRLAEMAHVFVLNESSSFLWEKLEAGLSTEDIYIDMANRYRISKEQAEKDSQLMLTTLIKDGLISPVDSE